MPKLTVDLASLPGVPAAPVRIYPVWPEDAHRLGQGAALPDGDTWLPTPDVQVPDSNGQVVFDIPASDEIGGASYTLTIDGGPTWVGIQMPATDATFTRALITGAPLPAFAGFRPSDLAATNQPLVGWGIAVAEGDQWSFTLLNDGGGIDEVRPTDLKASNAPAPGDFPAVGDGNEFVYEAAPIAGYSYLERRALGFTPVTSRTSQMTKWSVTLLDDSIAGGITPGVDFVTDYQGVFIVDVDSTTNYHIENIIQHRFADGTIIESTREIEYRIPQGGIFTVPLNAFSARSRIELGAFTDDQGNTITITPELLAQAVQITHKLTVERVDGQQFRIDTASMSNGFVTWWQLSQVKPNPAQGPQGPFRVRIYQDVATPTTPTGGTVNVETGLVTTAPTGWLIDAPETLAHDLYVAEAVINPATQSGDITPKWGPPFEIGAHGTPGKEGPPGSDATVTKAAVYPITAQIVKGSSTVTVTADPTGETLTLKAPHEQTDIYPGVAQIMHGSARISITPDNTAETLTFDIPNEAIGRAMLAQSQQLPLELGDVGQKLVVGTTLGVKHSEWIDDESAVTQQEVYRENQKVLKAAADETVVLQDDDDASTITLSAQPTKAQVYDHLKSIVEVANNDLSITDDDPNEQLVFGVIREIVETDWANLPVGFGFRVGTMVPRSGLWFIAKQVNQKGAVGPNNDPTNFEIVTTWAGDYNGAEWYLRGTQVLYKGRIATATTEVVPADPAPDAATNTKWHLDGEQVTKAAVYTQAKTIVTAGDGITVTADDDDDTLTITAPHAQTDVYPAVERILDAGNGVTITPDADAETLTVAADEPTQAGVYPPAKAIVKAGANIDVTPSDTAETLVLAARLPDEAAPRLYALDSRDVRNVQPPYSFYTISEGIVLRPNHETTIAGPVSRHDYDDKRPGYNIDTNNGRRNSNGEDFTNTSAGTTTREIAEAAAITMANERQYGSDETLTLRIYTYGYAKPQGNTPDNMLTETKVFNFKGGYQDDFHFDWVTAFRQAPRSGEHDGYRATLEWSPGSTEVVAVTIDAVRETHTLPALGQIPTQTFGHHNARHLDTLADWIPRDLKDLISGASRILTWTVGTPNNTGRNGPDESDKADVTDPVIRFGDSDGQALDKPFLRAEQDLSRVKLHFEGAADADGGDVYLCTRIQGYPPTVLANTKVTSAWSLDYTAQGAISGQDFYLIDVTGGGVGAPSATWDANPASPRIVNVIDGIFHTARLQAGINFTPVITHEFTINDPELNLAAEAGLLHVIRIFSNDVATEIPLRAIPRPVPFGSSADNRIRIGPGNLKPHASQGGASTIVWVNAYRDINGMHFVLVGTMGTNVSAYVSGAEIEYAKYTV